MYQLQLKAAKALLYVLLNWKPDGYEFSAESDTIMNALLRGNSADSFSLDDTVSW